MDSGSNKDSSLTQVLNHFLVPVWLIVICFALFSFYFIVNQANGIKALKIQFHAQHQKLKSRNSSRRISDYLFEAQKAMFKGLDEKKEKTNRNSNVEIKNTSSKTYTLNEEGDYVPQLEDGDEEKPQPTRIFPGRRHGPQN